MCCCCCCCCCHRRHHSPGPPLPPQPPPPPPPLPQPPPQPPALAVALPAVEQTLHRTLVLLLSTREALVLQCALVVGGLIGIFGFGEIKDKLAILIFLLADALVIAGAVLLGAYGPGTA